MVHTKSGCRICCSYGRCPWSIPEAIWPIASGSLHRWDKQLIKETCIPCGSGNPEKLDSVYIRNGAADVFMISEPPAGKRGTVVTKTRKTVDFAQILKYTADVLIYGQKRSFLSQITSISIQQPLYIKHLRQRKHAGWQNGLNGLIPQNTGSGWIWQRLKSALWAGACKTTTRYRKLWRTNTYPDS